MSPPLNLTYPNGDIMLRECICTVWGQIVTTWGHCVTRRGQYVTANNQHGQNFDRLRTPCYKEHHLTGDTRDERGNPIQIKVVHFTSFVLEINI